MRRRVQLAALVPAMVSSLAVAGCSDMRAADLCTQYEQATTRADEIRNLEPSAATVDDLRQALTEFRLSLDQLQAAGDGRLDTVISHVRAAVQDFIEAAVDNGRKALETAQPLQEDSLTQVREQWGLLEQQADAECGTG